MWRRSGGPVIKVCGITNVGDADRCADLGVDGVGMILAKPGVAPKPGSPRLAPDEAAHLVAALPRGLHAVLLIHATEFDEIAALCERIRPSAIQVQREIEPATLRALAKRSPQVDVIKSFRVTTESTVDDLVGEIGSLHDAGVIDAALLDSARGGSGLTHDWWLSAQVVARLPAVPILLAGGLTPANVADAVRTVQPYGVDVMTGVSGVGRGTKDPDKIRAFVAAARSQGAP